MPCLKIPATMDETQFKNEVRRLRPQLMVAARRHTGDSDCAEDIVQDALLRLWQLHANLHMPIAPLAFVLVRNQAIDTLRRHKRTTSVETLTMAEPVKEVTHATSGSSDCSTNCRRCNRPYSGCAT